MKIELPYPPKELNPNKKLHWAVKMKHKNAYKDLVKWSAIGKKPVLPEEGDIKIITTFHPPDRRIRDDDNAISAWKFGRDALAELWNVNDRRFKPVYQWGSVIPGGKVVIEVL